MLYQVFTWFPVVARLLVGPYVKIVNVFFNHFWMKLVVDKEHVRFGRHFSAREQVLQTFFVLRAFLFNLNTVYFVRSNDLVEQRILKSSFEIRANHVDPFIRSLVVCVEDNPTVPQHLVVFDNRQDV